MTQQSLFVDPEKHCTACRGTGRCMDYELGWRDERLCLSCGGSGREADRPDPHRMPIPYEGKP